MKFILYLKTYLSHLRESLSFLKAKFATSPKVVNFKNFIKSDPSVLKLRDWSRNIHPYLYDNFFLLSGRLVSILIVLLFMYGLFWQAPWSLAPYSVVSVPRGASLGEVSSILKQKDFIRSSLWFKFFVVLVGGQRSIIAGEYYFKKPPSVFTVSYNLLRGRFGLTQIRVSIPEGLNSSEMADLIALSLPRFDKNEFISLAEDNEGYLFPDTYFFNPNETPSGIIALMRENFSRQIVGLTSDIEKSEKKLEDIVIVASMVEDETHGIENKRIVSGVIWKRLRLDMPLQMDSTLRYINGKASHELTLDELQDENNPYNTYANKGLPPTPISSPGLDSLRAAIAPTNTDYLYFLSDSRGGMHYAETFEQHKRNREAYIK